MPEHMGQEADLLLSAASRPGLLQPGSPVQDGGFVTEVVPTPESERLTEWDWATFWVTRTRQCRWYRPSMLGLDLSQKAGRNRAAEWLAEQVQASTDLKWLFGSTSPGWQWSEDLSGRGSFYMLGVMDAFFYGTENEILTGLRIGLPRAPMIAVPALATLDLADPRLLPDGSRWVDARALVLCCGAVSALKGLPCSTS